MIALLAVALASPPMTEPMTGGHSAVIEPPVLPEGTPDPVPVEVDGETWVALHPDLLRYRVARSAYADQLAVELRRSEGLRHAGDLELSACRVRLDAERSVSDAWAQRVEEYERYADRVERRERRQGLRDGLLVAGGAGLLYAGAKVAQSLSQ